MGKKDKDKINDAKQPSEAPEKAQSENTEPQGTAGQKAEAPDAAAGADAKADDQKSAEPADGQKENEKEKTLSEAEVLKLYLQQSMAEIKRLKGEAETLRKEKETQDAAGRGLREKYSSLAHEYENYRRRTAEEKAGIHDDAVAQVVTSLLPALDNLERAMEYASSNAESFQKGVEMTLRQLAGGFKKLGVEEIDAQDQPFDPKIHSAVMHVEDDQLGDSVVADVLQKGYRIGDRVIRHSMVKVAN